MPSISTRLVKAWDKSHLSVTEMALWIGVHRATMHLWLKGTIPTKCRESQVEHMLSLLEDVVREKEAFPVPLSLTQFERKDYILGVRDAMLAKSVSKSRSTK